MSRKVEIRVARGVPGALASHTIHLVETFPGMTVLDALEAIRSGAGGPGSLAAPELRYRHSCHHGSCGSCGAVINGKEALMCLARVDDLSPGAEGTEPGPPITVEPLRHMDAVGDLAVDPSPLFSALPEGASYLRKSEVAHGGPREEDPASPYVRMEACIECGLCVSACPAVGKNGGGQGEAPFAGPAALAMADRDREERPERLAAALAFAASPGGVGACDRVFACSRACPQGVAPGRRIESLRRSLGPISRGTP